MSTASATICSHLTAGPYPFETVLVLDDHMGPTDWLVRCRDCGTTYLLEMLDWLGPRRLYRLRRPAAAAVAGLIRDLERGSCDLNRASAEAQHFSLSSRKLNTLMLLDLSVGAILSLIDVEEGTPVPGASWRDLPCDGCWIRRLS